MTIFNKIKYATATALMVGAMSMPVQAADYVVDTKGAHASINFRVSHLGFSFVTGRFDKFSGTFSFDEKDPSNASVKIEIDATSVNTNHAARDKHVRSNDFLDVSKFPTASFESTSFDVTGENAVMHGKLTMHGVTKDISIDVEHVKGGKDPWGGIRRGFVGSTVLKFSDYNIKMDFGTVALDFVIEGIQM